MKTKFKLSLLFTVICLFTVILSVSAFAANDAVSEISAVVSGQEIKISEVDSEKYLFLPSSANLSDVTIAFETENGNKLFVCNGDVVTELQSGDAIDVLSNAVFDSETNSYAVTFRNMDAQGAVFEETVYFMQSANASAMYIHVEDPLYGRQWVDSSVDHSNDAGKNSKVTMYMEDENAEKIYDGKLSSLKGRGNSTWGRPKKPYQIKLDKKTDLLNSGDSANKNKTWILLANALDKTLFKNAFAFDLARYLGLSGTPEYVFVDLYFDGEYRGSYFLCEKVQINDGRIEIDELEEYTTASDENATARGKNKYGFEYQYNPTAVCSKEDITGGYLLEIDSAFYAKENSWFTIANGNHIVIKSPEFATKEQVEFISEYFNEMYLASVNNVYDGKSVTDYVDIDSVGALYTLNEYLKNCDYCASSTYYFMPEVGNEKYEHKLYAGPAWDFDTSLGNRIELEWMQDPTTLFRNTSGYFKGSVIRSAIKNKTEMLDPVYDLIFSDDAIYDAETGLCSLKMYKNTLDAAQKMNFTLWPFDDTPNSFALPSYEENYDYVYNFLKTRHHSIVPIIENWEAADYESVLNCMNGSHTDKNYDDACDTCGVPYSTINIKNSFFASLLKQFLRFINQIKELFAGLFN